jgi:GT2 family glycosyltransferase
VDAGLAQARGETVLLSNADVLFAPGSLSPLYAAAGEARVGAAGPAAFWDEAHRIRMPAGFSPGFWRDLAQYLAGRFPGLDRRRFSAFARRMLRLWQEGGETDHLSGFALAARRGVFARIGAFDRAFPHEFEETEWQDRVRRAGLGLRYEPASRVTHLWGASAHADPPQAQVRRSQSRRLYRRRRFGRVGAALLESAAALSRAPSAPPLAQPRLPASPGHWVAISPNASGIPFAGAPLETEFSLPEEISRALPPAAWLLTIFRASDGEPVAAHRWDKVA